MISRTAQHCFWLMRHLERVEFMTRLFSVNQNLVLDLQLLPTASWYPLVCVAGEEKAFLQRYGEEARSNIELIKNYLIWQEECPVGIFTTLNLARENARVIRDTLSLEIWETINTFWLWLHSQKSRTLSKNNCHQFYAKILEYCQNIHGLYHSSLMRGESYYYMQLGMMLERANQMARMMDVKYHRISTVNSNKHEDALETVHWLSLLKSCLASESFLKSSGFKIKRLEVARFLILNERFPRTMCYALGKALGCLKKICVFSNVANHQSLPELSKLYDQVRHGDIEKIVGNGFHDFLTYVVETTAYVCDLIEEDFFVHDVNKFAM